ncbi:MAG: MFS transporter [Gammaproteobacteria bacterium]|nr:MFS transporter [Gammaproteobacteria bacterium]
MKINLTREQWKTILLSNCGGALEYYDFTLFAVFAVIIGQTFFPSNSVSLSTFFAFLAFATGYLIRPIGGMIFGHFGDKYGRKKPFVFSIIIMSVSTFLMGVLPSYHTGGGAASLAFIVLRILQGIATGGEIPGAMTFSIEHSGNKNAGVASGSIMMFMFIGAILSNVTYLILYSLLSPPIFHQYGWRIAFMIGGIFGIIGLFLRMKLKETPDFLENKKRSLKENHTTPPLVELLKTHFSFLISGFFLVSVQAAIASIIFLYMPSYLQLTNQFSKVYISSLTIASITLYSVACFFWGAVSDRYGQKKIFLLGLTLIIPASISLYLSLEYHFMPVIFTLLTAIIAGTIGGTYSAILANAFPTKIRYSGIAVSLNISVAIFGGLSPSLSTFIIHDMSYVFAPVWIISGVTLLGYIGFYFLEKLQKQVKVNSHLLSL